MPRPVKDAKLDSRTARERLKPRGKPYWLALDRGLHLGYRKGKGGGQWVRRIYLGNQGYDVGTFATADDRSAADGVAVLDFWQAQARAREIRAAFDRGRAGVEEPDAPYTVRGALDDYLDWLVVHRKSAVDARSRVEALIAPELGEIELSKLTTKRIRDWLEASARAPARLRRGKGKALRHRDHDAADPEAVRRRRATANRSFTVLRAALNHAWREGKAPSDAAWRRVKPFRDVDAARVRYLQLAECTRLTNACPPDFRRLVEAALLSGMRYGELCALDAGDFNPDAGTVHVRASKTGRGRHVVLTAEGEAFFAAITAGMAGDAPMFPRADGGRWGKSHQRRPLRAACHGARIDPPADFHSLRHTYAASAS